ncbi:MAG: type II toxin-antitoxin system PemK/MazF family toxin [Candidatus Micrarchaeota archaeon]|nr:type II toxin-antitoxin system PemK/MazF family toxin [Candidatus Micrarchaeota archaeon]
MKRREVVLARVFFSDSPESKVRPAIILSDEGYIGNGFLLLASITTANDDYCIPISEKDVNCPMAKGSSARFDGIIKLPAKQIIKGIGRASPEFYAKLIEKIIGMIR